MFNDLKNIHRAVLKIFAKALKFKNYHKIITRMILEKQFVLEIANTIVSKRHILKVFSSNFITISLFRCIYYYYAKTKVENVFAIYFETNIRIFFLFLYILFAVHHSLRCWCLLFKPKSGSRKISILVFSRFFVYRCHGNIDFHKM